MESKYNIENFEKFLRDKTDEFKMYPSKRVWYSIYNNMHPGNKLPSVSMCIILICSLLLVGYLNTDTQKNLAADTNASKVNAFVASPGSNTDKEHTAVYLAEQQVTAVSQTGNPNATTAGIRRSELAMPTAAPRTGLSSVAGNQHPAANSSLPTASNNVPYIAAERNIHSTIILKDAAAPAGVQAEQYDNNEKFAAINIAENTVPVAERITAAANNDPSAVTEPAQEPTTGSQLAEIQTTQASSKDAGNQLVPVTTSEATNPVAALIATSEKTEAPASDVKEADEIKGAENKTTALSGSDKAWIENFAMYNRPVPKKWVGKLSWQAYITPSVVYRKLYNNTTNKSLSGNGNGNFNNSDVDNTVIQKPSFGIETGLSLQYDLLKWVKVKAGVQLNYTRYNSHAYENHHPISTSLIMNGDDNVAAYEVFRTTPYSNTVGLNPIKLHNETYQLSLPVGADLRLFSRGKLAWYAGATIQPTFVIYANTFLLSGDRRNYVKDASMLNRFNLNAGFETYISFKTDDYTWQIGPQFRSQIFSTSNKVYSVEERLVNYGLKIGITKKL